MHQIVGAVGQVAHSATEDLLEMKTSSSIYLFVEAKRYQYQSRDAKKKTL
jgi:hypothetical protein